MSCSCSKPIHSAPVTDAMRVRARRSSAMRAFAVNLGVGAHLAAHQDALSEQARRGNPYAIALASASSIGGDTDRAVIAERALMDVMTGGGDSPCGLADFMTAWCDGSVADQLGCAPLALAYSSDARARLDVTDYPAAGSLVRLAEGLKFQEFTSRRDRTLYNGVDVGGGNIVFTPDHRPTLTSGWFLDFGLTAANSVEFAVKLSTLLYTQPDAVDAAYNSQPANRDVTIISSYRGSLKVFLPALFKEGGADENDVGTAICRPVINWTPKSTSGPGQSTVSAAFSGGVVPARSTMRLVTALTDTPVRALARALAWYPILRGD